MTHSTKPPSFSDALRQSITYPPTLSDFELWVANEETRQSWITAGAKGDIYEIKRLAESSQGHSLARAWAGEALMQACCAGHRECVGFLAAGADPMAVDLAVCAAAEHGHAECIQALGPDRLDPSFTFGSQRRDALAYACLGGRADCARVLAPAYGLGTKDGLGYNSLMTAAHECDSAFFKELLPLHDGERGPHGINLLMAAASSGDPEKTRLALTVCDPAEVDDIGLNALMFCASSHWGCERDDAGALESMALVAAAPGYDLAAQDCLGDDAMSHAAYSMCLPKIQLLDKIQPGWIGSCASSGQHAYLYARESYENMREAGRPFFQRYADCLEFLGRHMRAKEERQALATELETISTESAPIQPRTSARPRRL